MWPGLERGAACTQNACVNGAAMPVQRCGGAAVFEMHWLRPLSVVVEKDWLSGEWE